MIGLIYDLYVVAFNPHKGSFTEYILKYSSHVLLLFFRQRQDVPCMADDDIAIWEHDTCIG